MGSFGLTYVSSCVCCRWWLSWWVFPAVGIHRRIAHERNGATLVCMIDLALRHRPKAYRALSHDIGVCRIA